MPQAIHSLANRLPLLAADAGDAISSFSPYAALGANGVLVCLCVWLITKHMPAREEQERLSRKEQSEMFATNLKEIRDSFEKQLAEQRKQSADLAKSGQRAVTALSEAFHELALALSSDGVPLTKSGILKRRTTNQDSVLE